MVVEKRGLPMEESEECDDGNDDNDGIEFVEADDEFR